MYKMKQKAEIKQTEKNNASSLRAFHIFAKGKVQGVGFRYWTCSLANSLNIKGRVRNRADYSVEIFAEGNTENLKEFIYALKNEHPYARVENLTTEEVRPKGFKSFNIEI